MIPIAALRYERMLVAAVHLAWGLNGPVATIGSQVQQESGWRPDARSPYAVGIAQFTPATAAWVYREWPDLGPDRPLEPAWALRALTNLDRYLFDHLTDTDSECSQWAMTLSAYNGGLGFVGRDRALTMIAGDNPAHWWNQVERYSTRSDAAWRENRRYVRRILLVVQPVYQTWGRTVACSA